MRLELDVFGDKQLSRELLRFGDRAIDARPAWDAIMHRLADTEQRQFDTEGQTGSGGWAPLAPATVARKAMLGQDPRILHATGRLEQSLTQRVGGIDAERVSTPDEMRFGTSVPYARFHQTGTGRMPRRRPLELAESVRREVPRVLQRFITTGQP